MVNFCLPNKEEMTKKLILPSTFSEFILSKIIEKCKLKSSNRSVLEDFLNNNNKGTFFSSLWCLPLFQCQRDIPFGWVIPTFIGTLISVIIHDRQKCSSLMNSLKNRINVGFVRNCYAFHPVFRKISPFYFLFFSFF